MKLNKRNSSITLFQKKKIFFSFSIEHFDYFVHSWSSSVNCSFFFLNLFSSSNRVLLMIWLVVEMELFFFFLFIDIDVFFFEGVMNCINNLR